MDIVKFIERAFTSIWGIGIVEMNRKSFGDRGERAAVQYLKNKEYQILAVNFRSGRYEIDIIAQDRETLVFIEVKATSNIDYGYPEEKVDLTKQKHISKAAQAFIQQRGLENLDCRFDVIAIVNTFGKIQISHIEDAFWVNR